MARLAGFEPATYGLEVRCAIHCATAGKTFKTLNLVGPPGFEPGTKAL